MLSRRRWVTLGVVVFLACSGGAANVTAASPAGLFHTASIATCSFDTAQESSSSSKNPSTSGKQKYSHANDFLIRGTIFTDKGMSFPGVQLRIRRAGDKKFHWQDATNSRGEFAIRVPQGSEYEMVVHVKGFADQTRSINAKGGLSDENVSFQMQPLAGGKK